MELVKFELHTTFPIPLSRFVFITPISDYIKREREREREKKEKNVKREDATTVSNVTGNYYCATSNENVQKLT